MKIKLRKFFVCWGAISLLLMILTGGVLAISYLGTAPPTGGGQVIGGSNLPTSIFLNGTNSQFNVSYLWLLFSVATLNLAAAVLIYFYNSSKNKRKLKLTKYKVMIICIVLILLLCGALFISNMKSIPDKRWLNIKPGMSIKDIENIVGKPSHPSRKTKNMDRWIIDSALFNSRLIVYYRNPKQPSIASSVEVTRYCKPIGKYSVKIVKE